MTLKALGEFPGRDLNGTMPKTPSGKYYELILCSVKAEAAAERFS